LHYNLLFNGCSYTTGAELEGPERDYEGRDKKVYPYKISQKTGLTYQNIATNGASFDAIVRLTIEWFEAGNTCDLAIIQLTNPHRYEWISDKHKVVDVLMSRKNIMSEFDPSWGQVWEGFQMIDNDPYRKYRFYKNLFFLEQYLESKNINYSFLSLNNLREETGLVRKVPWHRLVKTNLSTVPYIQGGILESLGTGRGHGDYTPNLGTKFHAGTHPSELGHEKIADYIINNFDYFK